MKKLAIALTALAGFTAPALAADIAYKAPMPAPPPPVAYAPSWTGCYVAGGGGYGLWDQENTNFRGGIQTQATNHAGGHGGFGTAQVGCDYQFGLAGFNLVVGAFGDYDWDSFRGTHETPFRFGPGNALLGSATADEKMSSAWSVGGRLGWVAFPSLLTYFSAGYTEATFNRQDFFANVPGGASVGFFLDKATYKGFFIGGGDEYALSFLPGLFWKTEYRLSQFDTKTLPFLNATTGLATGAEVDSKKWVHTIRSELVYRFNWGGPAVSRY